MVSRFARSLDIESSHRKFNLDAHPLIRNPAGDRHRNRLRPRRAGMLEQTGAR
jgi:hypothetical protein